MSNLTHLMKSVSESLTHEQYIHEVRNISVVRLNEKSRTQLLSAKLVYGSGDHGTRGQCFYDAWQLQETLALIEVCAFGEESCTQLAGTTIHELAHCLAGPGTGHGRAWRQACRDLGLIRCSAAGQAYGANDFDAFVWDRLVVLPEPSDGNPANRRKLRVSSTSPAAPKATPCPLGIGTRGGQPGGPGSGSRLRLFMCQCPEKPYRARVACDEFLVTCNRCGSQFERVTAIVRRLNKPIAQRLNQMKGENANVSD